MSNGKACTQTWPDRSKTWGGVLRLQTTGVPGGGRDATTQDIVDALNANPEVAAEVWPLVGSYTTRIVEVRKVLARVFAGSKGGLTEADQISVLARNYDMLKQDVAKLRQCEENGQDELALTKAQLREVEAARRKDCKPTPGSSRRCERGTLGCVVHHNRAEVSLKLALQLVDEVRSVVFDLQVLGTRPGLRASEVNARADDWCRRAQEFDLLHGNPELVCPVEAVRLGRSKPAVGLVGTEILTFHENARWCACWASRDVMAWGETEQEAVDNLLRTIAHSWIIMESGGSSGRAPPVPPDVVLAAWRRRHKQSHSACLHTHTRTENDLEICSECGAKRMFEWSKP